MSPRLGVDAQRLAATCLGMTAIPSPTGRELALARWLATHLEAAGLEVELQAFGTDRANVVARLPGSGSGRTIALYSPIDTAFPMPGDDLGDPVPAPLRGGADEVAGWVIGSGAENPKGYASAIIEAATVIAAGGPSGIGDLLVVLAAGGMPSLGSPDGYDRGLGAGCRVFLERTPHPDAVVVAKPGDAVSWAEVGIAIVRVRVRGDLGYTGIRHRRPSRDAVRDAIRIGDALEARLSAFTARRTTDQFAPQAAITSIRGGWPDRPAFSAPTCELTLDVRTLPGETAQDITAAVEDAVRSVDGIEGAVAVEYLGGFPGAATDPDAPIVRAAVDAWERSRGRQHVPTRGASGVTDASILRAAGIPTARIGPPPPSSTPPDTGFTMGAIEIDALAELAATLIDIATSERSVASPHMSGARP